jgi:hypothetical protein
MGRDSIFLILRTFEHGGSPRQDDILVEASAHVDGTLHDRLVHHIRQRRYELTQRHRMLIELIIPHNTMHYVSDT